MSIPSELYNQPPSEKANELTGQNPTSNDRYNQLPTVEKADELLSSNRGVVNQVLITFAEHREFAITLVHRHCHLNKGEIMVTKEWVTEPERYKTLPSKTFPSAWLATGEPFEYTTTAEPAPPALPKDLLMRFQTAVKQAGVPEDKTGIPVLGICYAQLKSEPGIYVERTVGRRSTVVKLAQRAVLPKRCIQTVFPFTIGLGPPVYDCVLENGTWVCDPGTCPEFFPADRYNEFPSIVTANKLFSNRGVLEQVLAIFADHQGFALTLVHRHFELKPTEIMITRDDTTQPEKTSSPSTFEEPEIDTSLRLSASAWLATGEPFEYTASTEPAPPALPEDLLARFQNVVKELDIPHFIPHFPPGFSILGIIRAPTGLGPDEVLVERTELKERRNIVRPFPVSDRPTESIATIWMDSRPTSSPARVDTNPEVA